jgi:hypothetical protein
MGMTMQQQQQQQLQQLARNAVVPSGMNLAGMQENHTATGGGPFFDNIPTKLTSLNPPSNHLTSAVYPNNLLDPRPIDPSQQLSLSGHSMQESDLHPQRPSRKGVKGRGTKGNFEPQESNSSLAFDHIFRDDPSKAARMQESSMNISVDMLGAGSNHNQTGVDPTDNLGSLFNSSLRLSSSNQPKTAPPRRMGSGDHDNNSMIAGSFGGMLDMSVATLGDNVFEDTSLMRMTESQANMSMGDVFDEAERDLYVVPGNYS